MNPTTALILLVLYMVACGTPTTHSSHELDLTTMPRPWSLGDAGHESSAVPIGTKAGWTYFLTASHVASDPAKPDHYVLRLGNYFPAVVVAAHPTLDLALVRSRVPYEVSPFAIEFRAAVPGERLWGMGYPIQEPLTFSDGYACESNDPSTMARMTCETMSGNSGGAVVDSDGDLIGIATASLIVTTEDITDLPVLYLAFYTPLTNVESWLAKHF